MIKYFLVCSFFAASAVTLYLQPAASKNNKALSLKAHDEILIRTAKMKPHFSAQLTRTDDINRAQIAQFSLQANIETEQDIPQLNYKWILPTGVRLLNGYSAEGILRNVPARGGAILNAQFSNASGDNQKIHLRVWLNDGTNSLASSAQYNTQMQEEIDLEKSELAKRQSEYLADHPELIKKYK